MPFVVIHDDPRLLANLAQGVGAYRGYQDQLQQDNADRAFGEHQREFDAGQAQTQDIAYMRNAAVGDALAQRGQQFDERLQQQGTISDLNRRAQGERQQAGFANQDAMQQDRFGHQDTSQGRVFNQQDTLQQNSLAAAGERAQRAAEDRALRDAHITEREQMRSDRSESWHKEQQQNRDDDRTTEAYRNRFRADVQEATKMAEMGGKDRSTGAVDPTLAKNLQNAYDAEKDFEKSVVEKRAKGRGGPATQPAGQPTNQPAAPSGGGTMSDAGRAAIDALFPSSPPAAPFPVPAPPSSNPMAPRYTPDQMAQMMGGPPAPQPAPQQPAPAPAPAAIQPINHGRPTRALAAQAVQEAGGDQVRAIQFLRTHGYDVSGYAD